MATEMGPEASEDDTDSWSTADEEAATRVERRCGIALVPDGVED